MFINLTVEILQMELPNKASMMKSTKGKRKFQTIKMI